MFNALKWLMAFLMHTAFIVTSLRSFDLPIHTVVAEATLHSLYAQSGFLTIHTHSFSDDAAAAAAG